MLTRFIQVSFLFLVFSGQAHAFLRVCNQSNEKVFVAYGYKDNDSWIAEGWWSLEPSDCTSLISGDLSHRYYYIRAEGVDGGVWGGDYSFCTTEQKFTLADSDDCESSNVDREGFFQVDTGDSADWTTNLTSR